MKDILILVSVFFGAAALGKKFYQTLHLPTQSFIQDMVFCSGLGLGLLSYGLFAIGLSGFFYKWVGWLALIILIIILLLEIKNMFLGIKASLFYFFNFKGLSFFYIVVMGLLLIHAAINFIIAHAPPISWDALMYHLALPKLFIDSHKIISLPFMYYSYLPSNTEMLYSLAMLLGTDRLPQLMHFSFGILISIDIYLLSRRYLAREFSLLAVAIFYLTPIATLLSVIAYSDLAFFFYQLLAVHAFLFWLETNKSRWLILSALNCGFASGVKLMGIFPALILFLSLLIKSLFMDKSKLLVAKKLFIFLGIYLIVASPWYIRSYFLTGTPIYPFLYPYGDLTHPYFQNIIVSGISSVKGWGAKAAIFFEELKRFMVFRNPLKFIFEVTITDSDHPIGPIFLAFIPLIIFLKKINRQIIYLLIYCLSMLMATSFFKYLQLRYVFTMLPLLSIVVSYVAYRLISIGIYFKRYIMSILLLCFSLNLLYYVQLSEAFKAGLGIINTQDYLSSNLSHYQAFSYANQTLPKSAKIFLFKQERGYYLQRDYLWSMPSPATLDYTRLSDSNALYERLKELGVTHIFIDNNIHFEDYYASQGKIMDRLMQGIIKDFVQPVYFKKGVYIYSLK